MTEQSAGGQPRSPGGGGGGSGEPVRYRTAEMADAMLGSGLPGQQAVVLSVVPGEARDGQTSAVAKGACDAAAGGDACGAGSGPTAGLGPAGGQGREQAVLETVLPAPAEESNSTDGTKAPKVNCEERNTTGIDRFTLQILNVSQVSAFPRRLLIILNALRVVEYAPSAPCACFCQAFDVANFHA